MLVRELVVSYMQSYLIEKNVNPPGFLNRRGIKQQEPHESLAIPSFFQTVLEPKAFSVIPAVFLRLWEQLPSWHLRFCSLCSCSSPHSHPKMSAFNLVSGYVNIQEKAVKLHGWLCTPVSPCSQWCSSGFCPREPMKVEKCCRKLVEELWPNVIPHG